MLDSRVMTRGQRIVGVAVAANLLLVLAVPPYDVIAVGQRLASFAGFFPLPWPPPGGSINQSLLLLEVVAVLANGGIAWLLLSGPRAGGGRRRRAGDAVLILTAANLVVILLFPPFEYAAAMSGAALPSFEAFYWVFSPPPGRVLVAAVLYLEAILVLVNGGLLWLMLRERAPDRMSADALRRAAQQVRAATRR